MNNVGAKVSLQKVVSNASKAWEKHFIAIKAAMEGGGLGSIPEDLGLPQRVME